MMELVISVIAIIAVLGVCFRVGTVEDRIRRLRMSHDCLEARVMVLQATIQALASNTEDDENETLGTQTPVNSDYEPIG